ncbi:MAG: Ig-like domain-containing protein [Deltaproteobacteria bacterium]|nr:Ig-like domain-containing protein [Deltaproteobacteria bacterium]
MHILAPDFRIRLFSRVPLSVVFAATMLWACGSPTSREDNTGSDKADASGDAASSSGSKGGAGGANGIGGKGGSVSTGGSVGSGGSVSTGGSVGSGGSVSTGGSVGSGGSVGTGGATQSLPTISISQPANGAKVASARALDVVVSASVAAPAQIAKVEILEGTTILGVSTTAPFTVTLPTLTAGMRTLVARAVTGGNAMASSTPVSITVVAPPTVSITQPVANANLPAGVPVTLQAVAASAMDTITKVEFFDGATSLGEVKTSPYTRANVNLMSGGRELYAVAYDSLSQSTKSMAVNVLVGVASGAFVEQGGRVVFEAEDFTTANANGDLDWAVQSTDAGFLGKGYVVVATPNFNVKANNNATEPSAELSYALSLSGTGTYHVYARRRFETNGGDSLYFRLNNGTNALVTSNSLGPNFVWAYFGTIEATASGNNTFTLKRRESNAKIDRLVIDKVMQLPTGDGPPVSARAP